MAESRLRIQDLSKQQLAALLAKQETGLSVEDLLIVEQFVSAMGGLDQAWTVLETLDQFIDGDEDLDDEDYEEAEAA